MLSKLRIPWGRIWSSFSGATFLKTAIPYPSACRHNGWEELKPEERHSFPYPLLLALMQTTTTFPPVQPYKGKASLEVSPESSASPQPAARSCLRKEPGRTEAQSRREQRARRQAQPGPPGPHAPLQPPRRLTEPSQPLQQPRGADSSGAVVHSAPFLRDKEKEKASRYAAVTGRPIPPPPVPAPTCPRENGAPTSATECACRGRCSPAGAAWPRRSLAKPPRRAMAQEPQEPHSRRPPPRSS